jgi:DNA-binding MarR family transcriptional regulator/GNAT superfamily N-acetyltransferase
MKRNGSLSLLNAEIAHFRAFNRMYTRFLGILDEELLHSGFSLAEARVLYELAHREALTAKLLTESLGLDAGYLSRILKHFDKSGLLKRQTSKTDSRASILKLTAKGRSKFRQLNALSEKQAASVLRPLTALDRLDLIAAMGKIRHILDKPVPKETCTLRTPRPGDFGWVIHREAALYAQEYGFDATYETLVAEIVTDFAKSFDPTRERCWIAEIDGQNVGHIFLVKHKEQRETARLRLLLVEPSARGRNVGTKLVGECLRFARAAAYAKVALWTQSNLTAAHRIYEKAGFTMVSQSPHHSFGKDLIGQTWELSLTHKTHNN